MEVTLSSPFYIPLGLRVNSLSSFKFYSRDKVIHIIFLLTFCIQLGTVFSLGKP